MAIVTNKKDLKNLRISGKILVQVLEEVAAHVVPGITTEQLDEIAERETRKNGGKPAFKGYRPDSTSEAFPASICISLNEEIVHGIPGSKKVYDGDIISLDFGVNYEGMFTDCAITMPVGDVEKKTLDLLHGTYQSLTAGISMAHVHGFTGDIGNAVSKVAGKKQYGVVRSLIGHGVGYAVHEDPQVPNYGEKGTGAQLQENMVIAIEPMFTLGTHEVELMPDGWTFVTADESLSAHFEQTIRVTRQGPEIITPFSKKILNYARISH
jgi:methionyl aminopeptidase